MPRRQADRSEETKQAILAAARDLFGKRGFDDVTMREIAKQAGCSHTTIYIYFKDKEALLHELAMPPLQELRNQMKSAWADSERTSETRLKSLCQVFIHFCLEHRTMYRILFLTRASRVDEAVPSLEVQRLRNEMFGLLRTAIEACLRDGVSDDRILAYSRVFFFTLHGLIGTYSDSEEPLSNILVRLDSTFDLAMDVLMAGFVQIASEKEEWK